jgi:hypothetical protein
VHLLPSRLQNLLREREGLAALPTRVGEKNSCFLKSLADCCKTITEAVEMTVRRVLSGHTLMEGGEVTAGEDVGRRERSGRLDAVKEEYLVGGRDEENT